jgi:gamma-glutamyltranspeptidase/glutathione hydrolase
MTRPRSIAAAAAGVIVALFAGPAPATAQRPTTLAGRSTVYAPNAVVATSQPLASAAGLEVLRQGGNAVDAAVAAAAVLAVTEPHMTGIGGDMFAIVWLAKEQKLVALNASGRAGSLMTRETLQARGFRSGSQQGVMSVTVPGALAGWDMLLRTHGKRTLAQVLQPAIAYARDGHPVAETIAYYWNLSVPRLGKFPGFLEQFTVDGKRAPRKGELWRNPNLARTLQAIADGGRDAFYEGPIAKTIADYLHAQGGFLSEADLAAHHGEWVDPISTTYRGVTLWELPPNGQGIAALEMLNVLEGYDFS